MGSNQGELKYELKEKVFQIFKNFMARLAKLEELCTAGSRLLSGFQQGLEFLRRPPIDRTSELIENIVKANETKRVKSYFQAGCVNVHDSVQNMSKLRTSLLGLKDHLCKAKNILNELEFLLEDVSFAIQTANECLPPLRDEDFSKMLDQEATYDKEVITSSDLRDPEIMEIMALMSIIYRMVKQDYVMQERIVTSLSLKTLSGELESYCLMWSLQPYINDEITRQAWKLIPQ